MSGQPFLSFINGQDSNVIRPSLKRKKTRGYYKRRNNLLKNNDENNSKTKNNNNKENKEIKTWMIISIKIINYRNHILMNKTQNVKIIQSKKK